MDNNGYNNQHCSAISASSGGPHTAPIITEYKREYQWNPPMFGPAKLIKPEPMMSSYQAEFGKTITGSGFYSISQPASLTNSFNGHDTVDSGLMYNSMMNFSSMPASSNTMQASAKSATAPSTPPSVIHRNNPLQIPFSSVGVNQKDHAIQKRPASASAKSPPTTATAAAGIKSTSVLFNHEPGVERPSPPKTTDLTTEYHAKFRDFNEYVYLKGEGKFCEAKILKDPQLAKKAREWYAEVEERQKQACNYRARALLGVNARHPEYNWDGVKVKDRELEALALATRLQLEEKKRSKIRNSNSSGVSSIASTRSASARPTKRSSTSYHNNDDINSIGGSKLNSAPASLQDDRSMSKPPKSALGKSTTAKGSATASQVDKNNNTKAQSAKSSSGAGPQISNHQSTALASTKPVAIKKKIFIRKQAPQSSTNDDAGDAGGGGGGSVREFDPEPKSVPLKTTQIKSPEEIAGVKSPSPESWKVTIEKGGLDWVDGGGAGGGKGSGIGAGKNTGTGTAEAAGLQQQPVNFVDNSIDKQAYLSTNADQMIRPIPINGAAKINDHAFHGTLSSK